MKTIVNIIPANSIIHWPLFRLFFLKMQKQESNVQQVGGIATKNISASCL